MTKLHCFFTAADPATAASKESAELTLSDWIQALLIAASYKREIKEVVLEPAPEEAPKVVEVARGFNRVTIVVGKNLPLT